MNAKISVFTICVKAIVPLEQQLKENNTNNVCLPFKKLCYEEKKRVAIAKLFALHANALIDKI